jgi:hypothetical protein
MPEDLRTRVTYQLGFSNPIAIFLAKRITDVGLRHEDESWRNAHLYSASFSAWAGSQYRPTLLNIVVNCYFACATGVDLFR